jgi:hypothetical protein
VDPKPQSAPEAGAYSILHPVLADLLKAEGALKSVQEGAPDPERGLHLAAIRVAIDVLAGIVQPPPEP